MSCAFDYSGISGCKSRDTFAPNCGYWQEGYSCMDQNDLGVQVGNYVGGAGGPNAKCLYTDLVDKAGITLSSGGKIYSACFNA